MRAPLETRRWTHTTKQQGERVAIKYRRYRSAYNFRRHYGQSAYKPLAPCYHTTAPAQSSIGAYTIACGAGIALRSKGEAFPDFDQWMDGADNLLSDFGGKE